MRGLEKNCTRWRKQTDTHTDTRIWRLYDQLGPVAELVKMHIKLIICDMKAKLDPKKFANQKGLGIQHYFLCMLNRIISELDKCSKGKIKPVIAKIVDWKPDFLRQCQSSE